MATARSAACSTKRYRYNPQSCPNVNYYTADLILDKRDAMTHQAAVEDTISCAGLPRDQLGTETATHNAWVMVGNGTQFRNQVVTLKIFPVFYTCQSRQFLCCSRAINMRGTQRGSFEMRG
jgi:hypothetical protein